MDKFNVIVNKFVVKIIGEEIIKDQILDLRDVYHESSNLYPIIMILSSGADPMQEFNEMSKAFENSRGKLINISLGKG